MAASSNQSLNPLAGFFTSTTHSDQHILADASMCDKVAMPWSSQ